MQHLFEEHALDDLGGLLVVPCLDRIERAQVRWQRAVFEFNRPLQMLTKILKITQAMQVGEASGDTALKGRQGADAVIARLRDGKLDDAASILGEMADIQAETAARIIADRQGEPLAVVLKALGINRAKFAEIVGLLKQPDYGIIDGDRPTSELQGVFDSLSFNKARVLLTYWDWAMMKSGPYAPAQ